MKALSRLSIDQVRTLSTALSSGRLPAPVTLLNLGRLVQPVTPALVEELNKMVEEFGNQERTASALRMIAAARDGQKYELPELVWSGPDRSHNTRDTGVVVRDLFASASHEVLVSGFVVVDGREVFASLAARMEQLPELKVRLFLNIAADRLRGGDARLTSFARDFVKKQWPGNRLPEIFYDPRALEASQAVRASLHAKCVVVDRTHALVTSANFTPHAQQRNVELGVLLPRSELAARVAEQFDALVESQHFVRLHLR